MKHIFARYINQPAPWIALLSLGLMAAEWPAISDLYASWQTEEYSHGIIIPVLALLLACHLLVKRKPSISPSWLGLGAIAATGFLQLISSLSSFTATAQYGIIFGLVGISLITMGRAATRALIPCFIYLLFAIPLPHLIQSNLSQGLQLFSSTAGVWLLDLMGMSVFQEGNVIDLGGYRLQVVDACSGLRYLFPLMSFGYLIAFLLDDRFWKRLVIFLSTIPITIGMNSLRIAFIGFTVELWGPKMAEGFIHSFEGWTVFLLCTGILLAEVWLLSIVTGTGRFKYEFMGVPRWPIINTAMNTQKPVIAGAGLIVVLVVLFGFEQFDKRPELIPHHPPLYSFSTQIGDWHGQQDKIDPEVLQSLQLSDYWIANYKRPDDKLPINFYIAYYASQRVGVTTHSPSNCIPGGGWQIKSKQVKTIDVGQGQTVDVTRMLIRHGDDAQLVYYWFDERGRNLTETYSAKWYLMVDSMTMNRTDGALIRLVTPVADGENEEAAEKRMQEFMTLVNPQIKAFIPGRSPGNSVATEP